jgi:hypothetical protein
MSLKLVTITGADDNTDAVELMHLSKEYPFVEWGILVSRSQVGNERFPSKDWIDRFSHIAVHNNMQHSMHMCGAWVRQLLLGELNWADVPQTLLATVQRIQINTHAESLVSRFQMFTKLQEEPQKTWIFQWDGVNDHLAFAAKGLGLKVNALFDTSHGAGIKAKIWPRKVHPIYCGYAGGLSAENIPNELPKIYEAVHGNEFWIDMEGKVRDHNERLDLDKVRKVLKYCAKEIL